MTTYPDTYGYSEYMDECVPAHVSLGQYSDERVIGFDGEDCEDADLHELVYALYGTRVTSILAERYGVPPLDAMSN
jgi:hypothetical protein